MADFISSLIGFTPYSRKKRQIERERTRKSIKKNKKTVRIHSPGNTLLEYDLDNEEKEMKRGSPKTTDVKCGFTNNVYPCVYQETEFGSKKEWDDYILSTHTRNKSTNYRPIHEHGRLTVASLKKKGKFAKKIPQEYRIYNEVTGEIYDKRLINR